jgi:hypothetical protein
MRRWTCDRMSNRKTGWVLAVGAACLVIGSGVAIKHRRNNQRIEAATTRPAPNSQPLFPIPSGADLMERAKVERLAHHELIRKHQSETVDQTWAAITSSTIAADLRVLAQEHNFVIKSVDCRMTTCVGTISFPSYSDARRDWMVAVSVPNRARCSTEATLDEPSGPSERFELQIVYTCVRSLTADAHQP